MDAPAAGLVWPSKTFVRCINNNWRYCDLPTFNATRGSSTLAKLRYTKMYFQECQGLFAEDRACGDDQWGLIQALLAAEPGGLDAHPLVLLARFLDLLRFHDAEAIPVEEMGLPPQGVRELLWPVLRKLAEQINYDFNKKVTRNPVPDATEAQMQTKWRIMAPLLYFHAAPSHGGNGSNDADDEASCSYSDDGCIEDSFEDSFGDDDGGRPTSPAPPPIISPVSMALTLHLWTSIIKLAQSLAKRRLNERKAAAKKLTQTTTGEERQNETHHAGGGVSQPPEHQNQKQQQHHHRPPPRQPLHDVTKTFSHLNVRQHRQDERQQHQQQQHHRQPWESPADRGTLDDMLKKPWETDTKDLPDVTFAPQQKPSYTGTTTTRHMSDYPIKLYTRLSVGQLYSLIMLRTTSTWEDFVCEVSNAWPAFMFDTLCFHFTVLPSSGKLGTVDKEAKAKFLSMSMYGDMSVVRDQDTWTEEVVNVACEYYWDKHEVINFGVIIR